MALLFSLFIFSYLCHFSGSYPAGWRDPVCSAASHLPHRLPPSGETQDRPDPLHDRVVYVCLFQDAALGLSTARLGHVPL